jgi:hypothetical protein
MVRASVEQTIVCKAVYPIRKHHGVKYTPEALEAAAVADRYYRAILYKALDHWTKQERCAQLEQSKWNGNDGNANSNLVKDPILVTTGSTMASVISSGPGFRLEN